MMKRLAIEVKSASAFSRISVRNIVYLSLGVALSLVLGPFVFFSLGPDGRAIFGNPYKFSAFLVVLCLLLPFMGEIVKLLREKSIYFVRLFIFLVPFALFMESISIARFDPVEFMVGVSVIAVGVLILSGADVKIGETPAYYVWGVFILIMVFSLTKGMAGAMAFIRLVKFLLLFFILFNFMIQKKDYRFYLWVFLWLALANGIFCVVQEIYWATTMEALVGPGVDEENLKHMILPSSLGPLLRTPGLTLSYRTIAGIFGIALNLSVGLLVNEWPRFSGKLRAFLIAAATMSAVGLWLTFAKDIWLASATGVVVVLAIRFYKWLPWLVPAGLCAVLLFCFSFKSSGDVAGDLIRTIEGVRAGEQERINLNRRAASGFLNDDHFLLGKGMGAGATYTAHPHHWPAHCASILVAGELGVVGLLAYIGYLLWFAYRILILNFRSDSSFNLALARGMLGAMVVITFGGQFEANYMNAVWTSFFAFVEAAAVCVSMNYSAQTLNLSNEGKITA